MFDDLDAEDHADNTFVPVAQCAELMNISSEQVKRLVRMRLLATRWDRGTLTVQPVVVA